MEALVYYLQLFIVSVACCCIFCWMHRVSHCIVSIPSFHGISPTRCNTNNRTLDEAINYAKMINKVESIKNICFIRPIFFFFSWSVIFPEKKSSVASRQNFFPRFLSLFFKFIYFFKLINFFFLALRIFFLGTARPHYRGFRGPAFNT